jgi:hypothetical protein
MVVGTGDRVNGGFMVRDNALIETQREINRRAAIAAAAGGSAVNGELVAAIQQQEANQVEQNSVSQPSADQIMGHTLVSELVDARA